MEDAAGQGFAGAAFGERVCASFRERVLAHWDTPADISIGWKKSSSGVLYAYAALWRSCAAWSSVPLCGWAVRTDTKITHRIEAIGRVFSVLRRARESKAAIYGL